MVIAYLHGGWIVAYKQNKIPSRIPNVEPGLPCKGSPGKFHYCEGDSHARSKMFQMWLGQRVQERGQ